MTDEALVWRDETMFWNIVHTSPDVIEVEDLLNRARTAVVREKAVAVGRGDTKQDQALGALLTKINGELKYVHARIDRASWRRVVREVCGQELYDEVVVRLTQIQDEQKTTKAARGIA